MTNQPMNLSDIDSAADLLIESFGDMMTSGQVIHAIILDAYPEESAMTRLRIRTRIMDALKIKV